MGTQRIGQAATVLVAQHAEIEVHAVISLVPAAAGQLHRILPASGDLSDRTPDGVPIPSEELVCPGAGILDIGPFRTENTFHAVENTMPHREYNGKIRKPGTPGIPRPIG